MWKHNIFRGSVVTKNAFPANEKVGICCNPEKHSVFEERMSSLIGWSSPDLADTSKKPHTRRGGVSWKNGERTVRNLSRKPSSSPNRRGEASPGRWCREAGRRGSKAFPGTGTPHDHELARLKRELALVTRERDFLKEAAAFFAKTSR